MAQVLRLLVLAPDIQESVLTGDLIESENQLEPALAEVDWTQHQRAFHNAPLR